jgi:hypothetical protein
MKAEKLDLKKELKPLYSGRVGVVQTVNPGPRGYLCVDGRGDPNTSASYRAAVEALFSVSYRLKFSVRKQLGLDYAVMPLEGLWWAEDQMVFEANVTEHWQWTMMILQPEFVPSDLIAATVDAVLAEGDRALPRPESRLLDEGPCAQTLHVGPFAEEGPTVAALHAWIFAQGHRLRGKHHEIYLSDVRRSAPARWKTLIRQPYV